MADIRINSLPTTASASSSDDFLALDGATNGTRKLNAYSPTFGGNVTASGNLTVSGVTTSAGISNSGALTFTAAIGQVAGSIAKNATYGLTYYGVTGSSNDNTMLNASGAVVLSNPAGTTNATLAGNLTVSGNTANFGGADSSPIVNFKAADTGSVTLNFGGTTNPDKGRIIYSDNSDVFAFYTADTERIRIFSNGNFGIGTGSTDGGQKLQVSGTANIGNPFSTSTDDSLILHGKAVSDGSGNYGDYGSIVLYSSSSFTASARRYLITNAYLATDFAIIRSTNATTTPTIGTNGVVSSGTVDFRISESGNATFGGTIKTGSGSGETLSAGSIDVGADIGIASTQGIVQGGARIVTFTSGNATFAGNTTAKGTTHYFGADNSQRIELTTNNGSSQGLVEFYNRGTSAYFAARYLASSHTFEQGNLKFANYGAGTLTTDASGNVTASSDARLKTNLRPFARGLADVVKLAPKSYNWNETSGLDTENDYVGFVAQDVQSAIPEAVYEGKDANKTLTLNDRAILAALVNAVKELNAKLS